MPPRRHSLPTILAIDDDNAALSALRAALESAGYGVRLASSTEEARRFLDESDPDLIVLEVDTDHGAGWALLRDIVRFEGPPTIVVSHRGREDEIVEALTIGAVDVLPKPFRSNELIARVKTRLGQPSLPPPPPSRPPPARRSTTRAKEEPVFMTEADEQALLEPQAVVVDAGPDDAHLPLGARLHAARQHRKLTLVQTNLETKIPIWYLQAMEEEKFALLPRGPVAVDMVRTYAAYLGLDANRAVAEYRSHHDASPFKPLPSLGGAPAPREIPPWISIAVAALLALALGAGAIWYFARDEVAVLGGNLRSLVVQPTATATPSPTVRPTITPRPTRLPTATRTPDPTPQPSPTTAPTATSAPATTGVPAATAGP